SYTVFHKYQPLQVSLLGTKDVWQASNLHSFHIQEKKIAYFSLSPSTSFAIVLLKSSSASSTASGSLMILFLTSCFTCPDCSTSASNLIPHSLGDFRSNTQAAACQFSFAAFAIIATSLTSESARAFSTASENSTYIRSFFLILALLFFETLTFSRSPRFNQSYNVLLDIPAYAAAV